jgi:geranylgeranyl diphosphate synthase type II
MDDPPVSALEFPAAAERLRPAVEEALAHTVSAERLPPADCPDRLREAIAYSLLAGGKRMRPLLTLLACDACGGDWRSALPAACAVEMIHTYSLVHDDLPAMDDDDLRRGRPTCHKQFDEATAILAGDALLTLAFEQVARELTPPAVAAACCAELAQAAGARGMVGGQLSDLEAEGRFEESRKRKAESGSGSELPLSAFGFPLSPLESVHRRKTGALLACSLRLGATVAGASTELAGALTIYGNNVGLAFQIADDLLDVTGDAASLGKAVEKDAGRGKLTYPAVMGLEASRRRAEELVREAEEAVRPFGPRNRALLGLARFVLERDH